jgi:CubicO group peptidase (beta-lactamase class C family)
MMPVTPTTLACGAFLLLSFGGLFAQEVDPRVAAIESALSAAESDGLCGVVLLRSQDRELLHSAFGFADREEQRAMTTATGFDIGSLVKPITAVAVLKLEEEGVLSTSDTLGAFFADVPPDKSGITLMEILTHTSGMRDVFGGDYDVVSRKWLLARAMSAALLGPPGEEERYSNSGYSLLAMIIEDVSDQPYEAYVRSAILKPAGAEGIGYVMAGWEKADLAVGYWASGTRFGTPLDHPWADDGPSWNLRGNGGMLGTAEQMARWYEALFDEKILGPEALEKYYSFDAGESRSAGGRALGHAGGNEVFNTLQISWIDHDFHMTFFTSCAARSAEDTWRDFRDELISLAKGEPPAAFSDGVN